ncbi:MAG: peroxiredoxin [Candidatus Lokiarchaeota archaeon]|nr:peroxiredoxin [Candidatus Lokiarchaeota archaeon]
MLKENDTAPDFTLPDQDGNDITLSDLKGQKLVVYFYPKDNTPGCTTEAVKFRDNIEQFAEKGFKIIGISKDSVASHKKFQQKYDLNFMLLSDKDLVAAKAFGAYEGGKVNRRTWIIDEKWKIEKVFEKVSPSNHKDELCAIYNIKSSK